ncbi:MAG: tripartite tricarboxylate transporter substrate binding protein [Betaproteobacteria bacterium]
MNSDFSRRQLLLAGAGAALGGSALAQDYPSKPIRIVVPQAAGGGTDILARNLAARMTELLKQGVVVENRTGAGSLLGTEFVARAPADGYTLLMGGIFNMVMNKALVKNLSYSPENDFVSLGYVSAYPFVLLMRSDLPVNSLAELVAYAKARPGKLTYGSGGLGTLQHVWGAILTSSLGLDMVHVPFKGAAPAHQEMMAGRVDIMFDNISAAKPHIQAGRLKGLVVSSAQRSAQLPQLPTVNESGLTRFEGESWFGVFAPAATPAPVVARLRETLASINREPEFIARVDRDGGRLLNIAPAQQQAFLRDEIERWVGAAQRYKVTAD